MSAYYKGGERLLRHRVRPYVASLLGDVHLPCFMGDDPGAGLRRRADVGAGGASAKHPHHRHHHPKPGVCDGGDNPYCHNGRPQGSRAAAGVPLFCNKPGGRPRGNPGHPPEVAAPELQCGGGVGGDAAGTIRRRLGAAAGGLEHAPRSADRICRRQDNNLRRQKRLSGVVVAVAQKREITMGRVRCGTADQFAPRRVGRGDGAANRPGVPLGSHRRRPSIRQCSGCLPRGDPWREKIVRAGRGAGRVDGLARRARNLPGWQKTRVAKTRAACGKPDATALLVAGAQDGDDDDDT